MGLFDKMFGSEVKAALANPNAQQRFEELKQKYQPVLNLIQQRSPSPLVLRSVPINGARLLPSPLAHLPSKSPGPRRPRSLNGIPARHRTW